MSDSIDRVFAHALRTVRRLPRYGSSKPPPTARLRLYGLYKQSMEGDVESLLPCPTLPRSSTSTSIPYSTSGNAERSPQDARGGKSGSASSRDRDNEIKAEIEKWDAWYSCRGMSRTEAKKRYIEVLIQTMKVYAAGTVESRELVGELDFVWEQVKSASGSPPGRSEESLRGTGRSEGGGGAEPGGDGNAGGRLRVLSPVSRGGGRGEIVEGEDVSIPEREPSQPDDDDNIQEEEEEAEDFRDAPDGSEQNNDTNEEHPLDRRRRRNRPSSPPPAMTRKWRAQIEIALTKILTEVAALREQIDELHSPRSTALSSSYYPYSSRSAGNRRNRTAWLLMWLRWLFWLALRQVAVDAMVLAMLLLWGVWRGDSRVERWVGRRWGEVRRWVEAVRSGEGRWVEGWRSRFDFWRLLVRVLPARFLS